MLQFIARFREILLVGDLEKSEALEDYLSNLCSDLGCETRLRRPFDLHQAISIALDVEQVFNMR